MKNLASAILLVICGCFNAQTDTFLQLKQIIQKTHPEIKTDDKLIAFNVWSMDDQESREANKSFEKVYSVYEYAKLKGGLKGIIVVAVNKDNLSSIATITYTKDGLKKIISFKLNEIEGIEPGAIKNMVFDSEGNEVYKNLPPSKIFSSINQLITR